MNSITKQHISNSVKNSSYFINLKKQKLLKQEEYYENPKLCLECNSIIPYNKRKNKFCNSKCSGGYNTRGRKHLKETKDKISESIKKSEIFKIRNKETHGSAKFINVICPICKNQFKSYISKNIQPKIFCSHRCSIQNQKLGYIYTKKPKCGGYRKGSGRGKSGWYKGYWCDSSYELSYVIYNLDHQIEFQRNQESFTYYFKNRSFQYYPDFIQNHSYIEIKGFLTNKDIAKFKYFPKDKHLDIITDDNIKKYLNYTKDMYGSNFIDLYEGNPHNKRNNKCLICKKPAIRKYCSRHCAGIAAAKIIHNVPTETRTPTPLIESQKC